MPPHIHWRNDVRRRKRIMFLNVESHYGHGVVEGVDRYYRLHGGSQYYLGRDHSPEQLEQARAAMRHWKPDGIIAFIQNERLYRVVMESGRTAVNVTGCLVREIPSVLADTFAIGQLAAEYFLSSGFRNFAFAAKNPEASSNRVCDGMTKRLAAAGFPVTVFTERYK
jgi:DNA-binding LacI/PurR family transcriptional regulator